MDKDVQIRTPERGLVVPHYLDQDNDIYVAKRGDISSQALASAARASSTQTPKVDVGNYRGVWGELNCTVQPGGGETLTVVLRGYAMSNGNPFFLINFGVVLTAAIGQIHFVVYPGIADVASNVNLHGYPMVLPRYIQWYVVHSAAGSWTYEFNHRLLA